MSRTNSLQWRMSVGLALGASLMWVGVAVLTGWIIQSEIGEVFDAGLQETARRILPLAANEIDEREDEGISLRVEGFGDDQELLTYLVRDAEGRVLLRSHDAQDEVFPPYKYPGFVNTDSHRIYSDSILGNRITIAVAEPLAHRVSAVRHFYPVLGYSLLMLILISFFAVWWLVGITLRPIRSFQAEIEARDAGDLAPVAVHSLPKEFTPVAEAVNHLMGRVRKTLESERSFTANSAHELRTPIAAALAQTQRLIAESDGSNAKQRAGQVETALKRLAALSEKLMQLAKSEGGSLVAAELGDVKSVMKLVLDEFGEIKQGAERIKTILPTGPVPLRIDPDSFAMLIRNLVENALKHGAPDGDIRISLSASGLLQVTNGGDVVPPDLLKDLMRPFQRGLSEASGTGLGLAIAHAIVKGSGGSIELLSPATGRPDGFEVLVQLV